MVIEEVKFVNDVIQDTRIDARIQTKYDTLVDSIFHNIRLNWNNEGLALMSDEKLINLIEALEPERYEAALKDLKKKDDNKKE